jgi:hypothetical protein
VKRLAKIALILYVVQALCGIGVGVVMGPKLIAWHAAKLQQ